MSYSDALVTPKPPPKSGYDEIPTMFEPLLSSTPDPNELAGWMDVFEGLTLEEVGKKGARLEAERQASLRSKVVGTKADTSWTGIQSAHSPNKPTWANRRFQGNQQPSSKKSKERMALKPSQRSVPAASSGTALGKWPNPDKVPDTEQQRKAEADEAGNPKKRTLPE